MKDYSQVVGESKASQDKEELLQLLQRLDAIDPDVVVEIGVDQGYSIDVWYDAFRPTHSLGVDVRQPLRQMVWPHRIFCSPEGSNDEHIFRAISRVANTYKPIDFLFIDGNHMYDQVKADFERYSPLVRKGGMIVFHDARITDNDTVEVYKFWNEIKHNYTYEEIFSQTGTGTGILWK